MFSPAVDGVAPGISTGWKPGNNLQAMGSRVEAVDRIILAAARPVDGFYLGVMKLTAQEIGRYAMQVPDDLRAPRVMTYHDPIKYDITNHAQVAAYQLQYGKAINDIFAIAKCKYVPACPSMTVQTLMRTS